MPVEEIINNKKVENKQLILIPKIEEYIEYMLCTIVKIPRTERYNIGNDYKLSMYKMLEKTFYLNKINRKKHKQECLEIVNYIDVALNCQRIYLRIMKNQNWIDSKKFDIAIKKIYEIGNIIGGLSKIYAKDN